jgi:hypothetical protein
MSSLIHRRKKQFFVVLGKTPPDYCRTIPDICVTKNKYLVVFSDKPKKKKVFVVE